jgi:hypothetical protein
VIFGTLWRKIAKNADNCATLRQACQLQNGALNGFRTKMAENADVCSALFRSHAQQIWAKKPNFVPGCSTRARANWNKHRVFELN